MSNNSPVTGFAEAYRRAVEAETRIRESAYLDCPETICGIEVLPLSIRHLVILDYLGSPFVSGGQADAGDVAQFLWIVSPLFEWNAKEKRDKFTRGLRRLRFHDANQQIADYVAAAFADAPGNSGKNEVAYVAWPAHLVHLFASEYGWDEKKVLGLPFRRAWQYWRCIAREHDPKRILFNPLSDRVKSDWLNSVNSPAD